jgi:hypothetical protein
MRALLILVCTISLGAMGCQTNKKTHCGACGYGCGTVNIGLAAVQSEQPKEVVQAVQEPEVVEIEQVKSTIAEPINPFAKVAEREPEPEPVSIPEYGYGQNHRWLLGHLQRVHVPKHEWKLRYAPLDEHDEWGGSVILAPDARLDEFQDGDAVYVEGEILNERPSLYLAGPLYRARIIRHSNEAPRIATSRLK